MVAGTEFDQCATGQETLNQQSEKQSFLKSIENSIAEPYLGLTQILCQLVDFLDKSKATSIQVLGKPQLE